MESPTTGDMIQTLGSTKDINDFFVKEVIMNHVYDLAWSNDG